MTSLVFAARTAHPVVTKYSVILLAGQSNASGYGHFKSLITPLTDPAIKQLADGSSGPAIAAVDPLSNPDLSVGNGLQGSDRIGFALTFAWYYLARQAADTGVMLVPGAYEGTKLVADTWASGSPGGTLYENAITQVGRALALNAGNTFAGVLWHQGESDVGQAGATYRTALDAVIDGFRARISGATNSWFILGGMVPEWVAANSGATIQAVLVDTPNRKSNCAYWAGAAGQQDNANGYDDVHYSAAGQLINGHSAYTAGRTAGLF